MKHINLDLSGSFELHKMSMALEKMDRGTMYELVPMCLRLLALKTRWLETVKEKGINQDLSEVFNLPLSIQFSIQSESFNAEKLDTNKLRDFLKEKIESILKTDKAIREFFKG